MQFLYGTFKHMQVLTYASYTGKVKYKVGDYECIIIYDTTLTLNHEFV